MKQKPIYLFSLTSHDGVTHVNSLHVNYFTPEIDFKKYDYLVITSKQVLEALKSYDESWKSIAVLAVSDVTAKAVKEAGGKILEYGSGYGDNLSEIIFSYPKEKKWLYLRAKEIASDFISVCKQNGYNIDEAVVYETSCSHDLLHVKVEDDATLIFTSPSSVTCFLKHHMFKDTQTIVVIGKTTAKAMPYHVKYKIADEPTMQSCIQKAKE
ncbi:uroporphyrinogen-III synthase [Sulfurimonas sp. HSL3-2]|uniref:uroporphyrinogen-III synthase n=1 Tax=Hydrocurvibacter mobilis TaxID=3131936 RepID=UPI0031F82E45